MMVGDSFYGFDSDVRGQPIVLGSGVSGTTFQGWVEAGPISDFGPKRIPAALKFINCPRDEKGIALRREIAITGTVSRSGHRNLVKFIRAFNVEEVPATDSTPVRHVSAPVIATELIKGETMKKTIVRAIEQQIVHTPEWQLQVVKWGIELAAALVKLDLLNIVHRDIKPGNIMIHQEGRYPILIDFGIGRGGLGDCLSGHDTQLTYGFIGTRAFASPEQFCPGQSQCPASCDPPCEIKSWTDVYGLATTLWYAFSGRLLFESETKNFTSDILCATCKRGGPVDVSLLPDLKGLRVLMHAMLEGDAKKRPSPKAVFTGLQDLLVENYDEVTVDKHGHLPPSSIDPGGTAFPLPKFVQLGRNIEVAAILLPSLALRCWSDDEDENFNIDFVDDSAKPARVDYDRALRIINAINEDPTADCAEWRYRLPTVAEWMTAAGFQEDGARRINTRRRRFLDASNCLEWCAGADRFEVRNACFFEGERPRKTTSHHGFANGSIRLVRERRTPDAT